MLAAWIFAFTAPILWALMNVYDKYLMVHKVKSVLGFAVLAGFVNIALGLLVGVFLDWSKVAFIEILSPALAGALLGTQLFFYYHLLKHADASHVLGFYYVYPILVTVLSILFLNEIIPPLAYVGVCLTVLGAIIMSVRATRFKIKLFCWAMVALILTGALGELFAKVATNTLPTLHGISVSSVALGAVVVPALFKDKIRKGFYRETRNIYLAIGSEMLTLTALGALYFALDGLPVTIVSAVGATQPFFVVLFEWLAHNRYGKMVRDRTVKNKLLAVLFVIVGIVLLYLG